jgi:hypothetical protein
MSKEERLISLGVPKEKLRTSKRAQKQPEPKAAEKVTEEPAQEQAAAVQTEETTEAKAARMTWDEIMADPEYNKAMQETVKSRLKGSKQAQEQLDALKPMLELLSGVYGVAPTDTAGLVEAVQKDDHYYEQKAMEMGTSVEIARRVDTLEREKAQREAQDQQTIEQQKFRSHIISLEQQGEALKQKYPSFDLRAELQNDKFARLTSPGVGLSVEDAYYTVHRAEIQAAQAKAVQQQTAQQISNSIQAGKSRPAENGSGSQAATTVKMNYRDMSPQQREALRQRIRNAAARGEKIYPGQ